MLSSFFEIIANGGITEYANKLDKLANKKKLTKEEAEFMNRLEVWKDHIAPKLSRIETKGELNIKSAKVDEIYEKSSVGQGETDSDTSKSK